MRQIPKSQGVLKIGAASPKAKRFNKSCVLRKPISSKRVENKPATSADSDGTEDRPSSLNPPIPQFSQLQRDSSVAVTAERELSLTDIASLWDKQ